MIVGYARTSTAEQVAGFEAQIRDLENLGCEQVFSEQVSSVGERKKLDEALTFVRKGDTLIVTRLDRLARSTAHLLKIVDQLEEKGVALRILDFAGSEVNSHTPTGKLMLTMVSAMAEYERSLMLERQVEGIQKAKALGKYKGRKPTARAKADQIKKLLADGVPPTQVAKQLSMSRSSVYRIVKETA